MAITAKAYFTAHIMSRDGPYNVVYTCGPSHKSPKSSYIYIYIYIHSVSENAVHTFIVRNIVRGASLACLVPIQMDWVGGGCARYSQEMDRVRDGGP